MVGPYAIGATTRLTHFSAGSCMQRNRFYFIDHNPSSLNEFLTASGSLTSTTSADAGLFPGLFLALKSCVTLSLSISWRFSQLMPHRI